MTESTILLEKHHTVRLYTGIDKLLKTCYNNVIKVQSQPELEGCIRRRSCSGTCRCFFFEDTPLFGNLLRILILKED